MRLHLVLFLLLAAGCSDADAEKLRKVGDKTYDRAALLAQQTFDELGRTLLEAPSKPQLPDDLVSRVQYRLKWERELQNQAITVTLNEETVTLTGTVKSISQKEQAKQLATQTVGVVKVNDELQVEKESGESAAEKP